jgi:hypothetical protein
MWSNSYQERRKSHTIGFAPKLQEHCQRLLDESSNLHESSRGEWPAAPAACRPRNELAGDPIVGQDIACLMPVLIMKVGSRTPLAVRPLFRNTANVCWMKAPSFTRVTGSVRQLPLLAGPGMNWLEIRSWGKTLHARCHCSSGTKHATHHWACTRASGTLPMFAE